MLVAATALTWWLGNEVAGAGSPLGGAATSLVLALAGLKGSLIALDYMALRDAPAVWRWLVLGWLLTVLGLITFVTMFALP